VIFVYCQWGWSSPYNRHKADNSYRESNCGSFFISSPQEVLTMTDTKTDR